MAKHTAHHHKTQVRHPRAVRHPAKAVAVKKAAAAKATAQSVAVLPEPEPRVIEVMELEFVDPDIMLDEEETAVTSFDDEDF